MRRLREFAARTPAERERYVDLLRAVAICAVVLGHWLIVAFDHDPAGRPRGHSALEDLVAARPATWLFQVMPVFFLVGGYANAASLDAHRRRGGDPAGWLLDRSGRLLRPTTVLLLTLAGAALVARLLGAEPSLVRTVIWYATIPLWFLAAYLLVVLSTPVTYALHRRFGLAVPALLVVLVALGDVGRLLGPAPLAYGNYLFGWLVLHQLGFAWRTGSLPMRARVAVPVLLVGLAALLLLTLVGPYPTSMINIPRARPQNMSPPSLALLALATTQLGLIMLLRDPAERWLRRRRPWLVVVGANSVVLTIFLWHLTAVILLVGALGAVGLLPGPRVGTTAWWLGRIPWVILLSVVLAGLVAIFGRIELRAARRPARTAGGRADRLAARLARSPAGLPLTVAGYAAAGLGLFLNSATPRTGNHPLGLPGVALLSYLGGAALLRLLRAAPAEPRPPG